MKTEKLEGIKMYVFDSLQEIAKCLITGKVKLGKLDYLAVKIDDLGLQNPVIFTQDMYDMDGKYLTWGNKNQGIQIKLETKNRYESLEDSIIYLVDNYFIRNDVDYLD